MKFRKNYNIKLSITNKIAIHVVKDMNQSDRTSIFVTNLKVILVLLQVGNK